MTSKKYVVCIVSVLYMYMIINLALWHGTVKNIFQQGDLNRMGSMATASPLTEDVHYPKHHTKLDNYLASGKTESFDVLTLGDSFSNGAGRSYYQDYLVNQYGIKVINAYVTNHCLRDLYILLNAGIIDEIKPLVIILESVARNVQERLGKTFITRESETERYSVQQFSKPTAVKVSEGLIPSVMFQANVKYLTNKLYHFYYPQQLSDEVYIAKLDRNFFTNSGQENTLLYIYKDFKFLKEALNAEMMKQNLNTAARLLKAKGIKLVFFAAADKYDLYYPYIIDKKGRPENPFFQKMRGVQGKEYIYIDTITPLREALARGEQDVYWLSDTHWSHKGIKIFCDELVKYILPELR